MTTGIIHDQNMEKQRTDQKHMGGCIAGFFHFFDRNHVVSSKRLCPKRLPPSAIISESGSISSVGSPVISREFDRSKPREQAKLTASPDRLIRTIAVPATPPATVLQDTPAAISSVVVSSFEFKEGFKSPSKLTRELPRLSLDSRLHPRGIRTTTSSAAAGGVRYDDESETQRRSPSVVARLMGLEPLLPSSHPDGGGCDLPDKKVELRRSASESRSTDLLHCRFTDGNVLPAKAQYRSNSGFATSDHTREKSNGGRYLISNCNINDRLNGRTFDHLPEPALKPRRTIAQSKGLYDYGDFFPEPKPAVVSSIYGDVEKRLKMRGIEEPSKDLETLKQILEALQFKGLLHHSKPPASQFGRRNFVYERTFPYEESPIVVMKPVRSPRRLATEPSPPRFQSKTVPRRNLNVAGRDSFSPVSPRRNPNPPGRSKSPATRRKAALDETSTAMETRRVSPVRSPRMGSRRLDQTASQSPRRRRSTTEVRHGRAEDESSTFSESSFSTSSRTDTEKSKTEECSYKDGKSLLERCNKLLNSIAEMSWPTTNNNSTELQQSPVSVLDSSLYKEDESPSPVMKRAIDFKDVEDEIWSSSSSDEDPEFAYVSEIIRASNHLPGNKDIFSLLEKKQSFKGRDASKSSVLQRRLVFDTINEILDRNRRQLQPWKSISCGSSQLSEVWSELQRIQKRDESEDMFEVICGVMKRDLTQDSTANGWGGCQSELSEAVLDVERLIYKDLIGETIRDLMGFGGSCRKLVF